MIYSADGEGQCMVLSKLSFLWSGVSSSRNFLKTSFKSLQCRILKSCLVVYVLALGYRQRGESRLLATWRTAKLQLLSFQLFGFDVLHNVRNRGFQKIVIMPLHASQQVQWRGPCKNLASGLLKGF